jgi:stage II sporulation protein D
MIIRGGHKDRLQVNGRWYRSRVSARAENGRVLVVNHVGLEQYLYGVLPRETYVSWPEAALQAQAVAARTYALYHMLVRLGYSYDVLSTTASQVYGGLDGEHPATNRAVDATRDVVLFNGRQLVLALYHANSGGVVEAVEDVWGARLPYLRRVVDTPSLQGRGALWTCSLSASEVVERLVNYGVACETIDSIQPVKRSGSGRVEQVALTGQGASLVISGNSLRLMLGPSVVKSTRFIVEKADKSFVFSGTGYGHGVGMSQWGAYAIAKNKDDYQSILAHYYPGAELAAWNTRGQAATGLKR